MSRLWLFDSSKGSVISRSTSGDRKQFDGDSIPGLARPCGLRFRGVADKTAVWQADQCDTKGLESRGHSCNGKLVVSNICNLNQIKIKLA